MSGDGLREVSKTRTNRILSIRLGGSDSVGEGGREHFVDWRDQLSRARWRCDSGSSMEDGFAEVGPP